MGKGAAVTGARIPVVLGQKGKWHGLSLWSVKVFVQVSDVDGTPKERLQVDHGVVAYGPSDAVTKMYSKYTDSVSRPADYPIVTKIEIVGIEWVRSVDVT